MIWHNWMDISIQRAQTYNHPQKNLCSTSHIHNKHLIICVVVWVNFFPVVDEETIFSRMKVPCSHKILPSLIFHCVFCGNNVVWVDNIQSPERPTDKQITSFSSFIPFRDHAGEPNLLSKLILYYPPREMLFQ